MGFFKLGGMTFGGLFKKKETLQYPKQTKKPYEGQKGTVMHTDKSLCTLCGICAKKCPCGAIEVSKENRTWSINHLKCIQCQYCTQGCPKKCLKMDPEKPCIATKIDAEVVDIPLKKPAAKTIKTTTKKTSKNTSKKEDK